MTDIRKKERSKSGAKGKKLQLNKETLKDLTANTDRARELKGGAAPTQGERCTQKWSNCTIG